MEEHFKTLGLRQNADADALKAAYKAQSLRCHPDQKGGSAEAFQRVGEAYAAILQHQKDERWGTSNSAYGGTQQTKLLTNQQASR